MTVAGKVSDTRYNSRSSLSSGDFHTNYVRTRVASFSILQEDQSAPAAPCFGAAKNLRGTVSINGTGGGF
jgi:hypothetical protein